MAKSPAAAGAMQPLGCHCCSSVGSGCQLILIGRWEDRFTAVVQLASEYMWLSGSGVVMWKKVRALSRDFATLCGTAAPARLVREGEDHR